MWKAAQLPKEFDRMQTNLPAQRGLMPRAAAAAVVLMLAVLASLAPAASAAPESGAKAATASRAVTRACTLAKRPGAGRKAKKRCALLRRRAAAASARTVGQDAGADAVAPVAAAAEDAATAVAPASAAPAAPAAPGAIIGSGTTTHAATTPAPAAATPHTTTATVPATTAPHTTPAATTPHTTPATTPPVTTTVAHTTTTATTTPPPASTTTVATTPTPPHTTTTTAPTATTPAPPHTTTATTTTTTATTPPAATTPAPSTTTATTTPAPPTTTATTTPAPPTTTTSAPPVTPTTGSGVTPLPGTPGTRLYSADSPFNTPIGAHPEVDPNSDAMVASTVTPFVGNANFANNDYWGIAIVQAHSSDPLQGVNTFDWGYGGDIAQPEVHIPAGAQATLGDDHHLAVFDGDKEMDMWVAERQDDGTFTAGARAVTSATGDGVNAPISGNAAGFALGAGLVRPEDIAAGRIDHALTFTSPYIRNTFVAPAVHGDGREDDADAMPMGTRIQLDPDFDISGLPRTERIMAQALKDYGAYLCDTGGSLAVYGEASIGRASTGGPSDIWTPVGVTDPSLRDIPWSHVRVIKP